MFLKVVQINLVAIRPPRSGMWMKISVNFQQDAAAVQTLPLQVDPGGLMTLFVTGVVTIVFSSLIKRSRVFPVGLGNLGLVNGVMLVILFIATVSQVQVLILVSGGLTSVILGPIWWIWLGRRLQRIPEMG